MAQHVKILGVLHIIFGALGVLVGLAIFAFFGGIAGIVGVSADPDAHIAIPILGGIGGLVMLLLVLISLPGIIIGVGLLNFRPWARILGIIISAIELIQVPFGTALGIYGLWVLLSQGTEQLFVRPPQY
jgi:hypothetical protein